MQVKLNQLHSHLQSAKLAPCWLVSGDEIFLVEEALGEIRQAAKRAGITERTTVHTEPRFDWSAVQSEAQGLSLFADRRMLEVRAHKGSLDKAGGEAMLALVDAAGEGLTLVVLMPKLESRVNQTKWYKALTKHGVQVPVWPVSAQEMPGWVEQRARKAGLKLTKDGLIALQYNVAGNLLAADQAINKLKLFADDTHWDVDKINQTIGDSSKFTVFDLMDASLAGRSRLALKILHRLALEGVAPLKLLAITQRELINLRSMRAAIDQGAQPEAVMKQHRVFYQRTASTKAALRRINLAHCDGLLARLGWVDQSIKGALLNDVWELMENIIASLSGARRLAPLALASERLLPHIDFSD